MARRDGITMWLDGEKELYVNMQKRQDLSTAAGRAALQKAGLLIVERAKQNLRANTSVVTGALRASGKVQKVANDPDSIDAGFFGDKTRGGYAFFVEYGRKAGRMPPPDELAQWFRKKHRITNVKEALGRGWALAKKIARQGTRPHPFFKPAIESSKKEVEQILKEAIKKEIDKNE